MSVEELVKELRQVAAFPRPIHKAPALMEQAADKLEELASKVGEWEERFWKRDAQADRLMQERDKAEAALAERDKEIDWQRLCDVINAANRVSARTGKEHITDANKLREFALARNAGGNDA